jgi:hypothetical protein
MDDLQKSSTMPPMKGRLLHVLVVTSVGHQHATVELVIGFCIRVAAIALLTTSSTAPFTATRTRRQSPAVSGVRQHHHHPEQRVRAKMRSSTFDYWDKVVLSAAVNQPFEPGPEVRMSTGRPARIGAKRWNIPGAPPAAVLAFACPCMIIGCTSCAPICS